MCESEADDGPVADKHEPAISKSTAALTSVSAEDTVTSIAHTASGKEEGHTTSSRGCIR